MDLLRIFHRTTVFGHHHWAREEDQMLCAEPASAAGGRLGENGAPRTSASPFYVGIPSLLACLADSLEALRVSPLHVEIRSDGPCSSRSTSKMAKGSGLHTHTLMIKKQFRV
jgi:hypothetical protein